MSEMRDRFRALDDLGDAPDIWSRAGSSVPGPAPDEGGPWRRAGIAAVALVVAAAAIGFAALPFLGGDDRSAGPVQGTGWLVFAGHPFREPEPPPDGFVEVSGGQEEPRVPDDLYLASPDGAEPIRLTDDGLFHGPAAWSPDGAWIAFTAYDTERWVESLWVVNADGTDQRRVCEGCTATFVVQRERECGIDSCSAPGAFPRTDMLATSPDGRRIAAVRADADAVDVVDVVTGSARLIRFPGFVDGVSWSPDGHALAASVRARGDSAGLYVIDASGTPIERVLAIEPYGYVAPAWSPDGATIAFAERQVVHGDLMARLVYVDAVTGSSRVVLGTEWFYEIYDLEWSPDGSRLAALHHPVDPPSAGLLTVAASGEDPQLLVVCDDSPGICPSNSGEIAWSADGSRIAYAGSDGGDDRIVAIPAAGGPVSVLSGDLGVGWCCLAWQPAAPPASASIAVEPPPTPGSEGPSLAAVGPVDVGPPNQTLSIAASDDAVWVGWYDDEGGHLSRLDPVTLEEVAVVDAVPAPQWESGGGGLAVVGGMVWVGGEDRLVGIDERTNEIVVDRALPGCCADLALADGYGFYAFTQFQRGPGAWDGELISLDPTSGETWSTSVVPDLRPRRISAVGGYIAVIGWRVSEAGGYERTVGIPVHFEDIPEDLGEFPRVPIGPDFTWDGWTTAAGGGIDLHDGHNLFEPIGHVDVPVGRIEALADGPRGVWAFGRDGTVAVLDPENGDVRVRTEAGPGWDPNVVTWHRDTLYLLGLDGRLTAVRFAS